MAYLFKLLTVLLTCLLLLIALTIKTDNSLLYASEMAVMSNHQFPALNSSNIKKSTKNYFSPFQEIQPLEYARQKDEEQFLDLTSVRINPNKIVATKEMNTVLVTKTKFHQIDLSKMDMMDMYFDEERPYISNGLAKVLEAVVETLSQRQEEKVMIEAHCDERGSSNYNLVLGESRGRNIAKYLVFRGVNVQRVDLISYGEEKPLCRNAGRNCREANLRLQKAFQLLSISHSRNGCVTRILLKQTSPSKGRWVKGGENPFLQQIHMAAPKTSAWSLSR